MQTKKIIVASLLSLGFIFMGAGSVLAVNCPYVHDYCPTGGGLAGWWGTFSPTYHLCPTTYYTYNSTALGSEESWYKSASISVMCEEPTPPLGPTTYESVVSRAYIPGYHTSQTSSAHYYKWQSSQTYTLIGTVNQYNTLGWTYLTSYDWSFIDTWKLSDWTNESYMSKTVDLDAFSVSCPNE